MAIQRGCRLNSPVCVVDWIWHPLKAELMKKLTWTYLVFFWIIKELIFTLQDQPKSRKQIVICQALYLACNPAKLILGLVRPSTYHWKASFKKCTRRSKKRKHEGTFCGISWPSFTSLQWPLLHSHTHTNLHTRSWDRLFFLRVIFPNISVMKRRTCFLSQEPTVFHSFLSYTIVDC